MLKKGDKVIMHTCGEAEYHKNKVWICKSDEFEAYNGTKVIFLESLRGYFSVKYLKKEENKNGKN
jgi:hypothetical protein